MRSFAALRIANKIYPVSSGEAALDYLFRRGDYVDPGQSPRPHLILLDLRLPKIDGLEVLAQLKVVEGLKKIPVVILTSSESQEDVAQAYDRHVNSYLIKPIDFARFSRLMADLGFYWLAWNRLPWAGEENAAA